MHTSFIFWFTVYFYRQGHDLLAADSNTVPHLELAFADYADLESDHCVELVSLLPPPLPPIEQLMLTKLCHTFTVNELELLVL